jgi:MoaA/NifB/PqqE/SkfB family radical SAM enzyme
MSGRSLDEFGAPLFFAWQLTNGCDAECLACCEESGQGRAWKDELNRDEALNLVEQIIDLGIPYVAFGGGEPLGVPHCWDIFERLTEAGVAIKLETNGGKIDEKAAARLHSLQIDCIQISVDGATQQTHELMRPGARLPAALSAIDRLAQCGTRSQMVFVPTRLNIHEITDTFELAVRHGCSAFVTGPLMRLGRAAAAWSALACDELAWSRAEAALRRSADEMKASTALSIYPWDILTELRRRLESPQAMLLVVPNGKVKLLNALPFAPADLRVQPLAQAWEAYRWAWRTAEVRDFIARCQSEPSLLGHANETWSMGNKDAEPPSPPLRA